MIDRKTIYDAAQRVVKEQDYAAKIYNVKRTPEEVIIHFYAEKRIPLKEFARDLEFTLNVPIKLERVTKEDFGRVGETQILAYHQCCAPLTKHCLFDDTHGCPYGIPIVNGDQDQIKMTAEQKTEQKSETRKKAKRKKVVRRVVVK